jgi:hypothetical protein
MAGVGISPSSENLNGNVTAPVEGLTRRFLSPRG